MGLGSSALRCLRDMLADPYETDILVEGRMAYCGNRPVSRGTVNQLLRCAAIKLSERDDKVQRYTVKEEFAKQIVARPALADEIEAAFYAGRNFWVKDGVIAYV